MECACVNELPALKVCEILFGVLQNNLHFKDMRDNICQGTDCWKICWIFSVRTLLLKLKLHW